MKAELHAVCAQLVGALLNGLYQGLLLSLTVGLLLGCWRRANAATRHGIWFATLLLIVLLIPAHYWLDRSSPVLESPEQSNPIQLNPGAVFDAGVTGSSKPEVIELHLEPESPSSEFELGLPEPGWVDARPLVPLIVQTEASHPIHAAGLPELAARETGQADSLQRVWPRHAGLHWLSRDWLRPISWNADSAFGFALVSTAASLWVLGAGIKLVVLIWRLRQLKKLLRESVPPQNEALRALFQDLAGEAQVHRALSLRIAREQRSALVLGFLQPTILIPEEMLEKAESGELEQVLRHELAHVRRYDDWANLIQHLVQAILWFNPAVWWIGKRLSLEREIACDDHVLQQGGGRRSYALVLANVAGRIHHRLPILAPGVSNSQSQLQQRIDMILNTRRNSSPKLATAGLASITTVAAVLAALGLYFAPRLVLGAPPAAPTPAVASSSAVAEPSSDAVAGIDAGPKFKPDAPAAEPPAPPEVTTPQTPEPPSVEAPDILPTPRVARAGKHAKEPQMADSPNPEDGADSSIEQRLRRLEKMVRALMDQKERTPRGVFLSKDGAYGNFNNNDQQMQKLKDLADRQAARAAEQAQRAADQAKRANEKMATRIERDQQFGEGREAFQKQLEALRQAREQLGREAERLDRQIQKLEREQQRGEGEGTKRRGDVIQERLHAQVSVTPEVSVTTEAAGGQQ